VLLFISGQHSAPVADEDLRGSKGAVHRMTPSLADALADWATVVDAINPGPVATGCPSEELGERLRASFHAGKVRANPGTSRKS
jgi:3-oxoacyl-[acyl-carrier protein] reductase